MLTNITFPDVRKVITAIASYIETAYTKDRPVLIAYDTRFLADQLPVQRLKSLQIEEGM